MSGNSKLGINFIVKLPAGGFAHNSVSMKSPQKAAENWRAYGTAHDNSTKLRTCINAVVSIRILINKDPIWKVYES